MATWVTDDGPVAKVLGKPHEGLQATLLLVAVGALAARVFCVPNVFGAIIIHWFEGARSLTA